MRALGLILVVLLPGMAICQPKPAFEIADVHVSPRSEWARTVADTLQGGYLAGERYELHRATMLDLIGIAYNMDAESVYGGPGWLEPVPRPISGSTFAPLPGPRQPQDTKRTHQPR